MAADPFKTSALPREHRPRGTFIGSRSPDLNGQNGSQSESRNPREPDCSPAPSPDPAQGCDSRERWVYAALLLLVLATLGACDGSRCLGGRGGTDVFWSPTGGWLTVDKDGHVQHFPVPDARAEAGK